MPLNDITITIASITDAITISKTHVFRKYIRPYKACLLQYEDDHHILIIKTALFQLSFKTAMRFYRPTRNSNTKQLDLSSTFRENNVSVMHLRTPCLEC